MKFLIIFIYLITCSFSYAIEKPNIKNLVLIKDPKIYGEVFFKDKSQNNVNLDTFKGKLVLMNFWATWCVPCKEEMPSLDILQSDDRLSNLKVLPINVGQEDPSKSDIFFEELNIRNLDIYFDSTVTLAKKFSLRGIPTTILFSKDGKEFARIFGSIDFNDEEFINWLKIYN